VEEKVLTQLISAGMIEAVEENGETLVAVDKKENGSNGKETQTKEEIIAAKFSNLRGQKISASEASRKYSEIHGISITQQAFSRWAQLGYIIVLERGYRVQLDEADVAYCAAIFSKKYKEYDGQMRGVNVFDRDGDPYQVKYPEVAEDRRNLRRLE
jgi:hypothetical protein